MIGFLAILSLKSKYLNYRRLSLLLAACIITIIFTLLPLRSFLFTRIASTAVHTEQVSSIGRSWLAKQALDMFRGHPILGVGVGSFILQLSEQAVDGAPIEPVHNLFLLIGSELGMIGLLAFLGLIIAISLPMGKIRNPQAILASGTLAGLGVISLFDHYLWSIAPGRLMLGLVLGLWAGQVSGNDA